MTSIVGKTVALTQCPATDDDHEDVIISGLFDVLEHHPTEPSAYVWTPCLDVCPHDAPPEGTLGEDVPVYTVDEYKFIEQTNPKLYGQILRDEREMELAAEREDMDQRFGTSIAGRNI